MKISFKEVIWYSIEIPEDKEKVALDIIKQDPYMSASDFIDSFPFHCTGEYELETGESIVPENNGGRATIEIQDDNIDIIWDNDIR